MPSKPLPRLILRRVAAERASQPPRVGIVMSSELGDDWRPSAHLPPERLIVHRLRVKFHVPTTATYTEVVSMQAGYTDDDVRAACAGSQAWPFESAKYIVLDSVEVLS